MVLYSFNLYKPFLNVSSIFFFNFIFLYKYLNNWFAKTLNRQRSSLAIISLRYKLKVYIICLLSLLMGYIIFDYLYKYIQGLIDYLFT